MNDIREEKHEGTAVEVIRLRGGLDMTNHLALKKKVRDCIDDGVVCFVIDMSELNSMDSTGIGTLVGLLNSARSQKGDLRLAAVVNQRVLDTLRLCGLTSVFSMYADAEEGRNSYQKD